jgi:hypothetical protein
MLAAASTGTIENARSVSVPLRAARIEVMTTSVTALTNVPTRTHRTVWQPSVSELSR